MYVCLFECKIPSIYQHSDIAAGTKSLSAAALSQLLSAKHKYLDTHTVAALRGFWARLQRGGYGACRIIQLRRSYYSSCLGFDIKILVHVSVPVPRHFWA
jgi:hypothetical protein